MSTVFPFLESQGCSLIPFFFFKLLSCSFTCSPVVLSVSGPVCLSLSFALSVSLFLSVFLCISLSLSLCLCLSACLCLSLPVCLSVSYVVVADGPILPTFSSPHPHPPSPQKVSNIFVCVEKSIVFVVLLLFCIAIVESLGHDRW